jgi:hypothetical protein
LVHPQNGLNSLILSWCIGGCWFTPAIHNWVITDIQWMVHWIAQLVSCWTELELVYCSNVFNTGSGSLCSQLIFLFQNLLF